MLPQAASQKLVASGHPYWELQLFADRDLWIDLDCPRTSPLNLSTNTFYHHHQTPTTPSKSPV